MKPTPPNITPKNLFGEVRPSTAPAFPVTDSAYHGTALEPTGHAVKSPDKVATEARSFRSISAAFVQHGSAREYILEALFFGWISLTAAWPLTLLLRALTSRIRH